MSGVNWCGNALGKIGVANRWNTLKARLIYTERTEFSNCYVKDIFTGRDSNIGDFHLRISSELGTKMNGRRSPIAWRLLIRFQIASWTMGCYEPIKRKFWEGNMNFKRSVVLLLAVAFALTITVSLASADYVVIKDKNGRCSVRESDHKTPKTIAGPFKTKEEAQSAKEKEWDHGAQSKETAAGLTRQDQREG